ncbi:MAG: hypothetical protein UX91_C0006G0182 [Candidatus Amesbacteria bacterium GW2011_GWB1_47_19]|nr:MAG: hypothetical protein UW51_C0002G0183 [Candidatus Amesbacteria bacterium GW2011_GWA1_44_24]KKU31226.1 MAG: hypothetical protein UX46_C0006G0018 [Candidatus Amesbacteria bacterium GW2011_GWC1_46_24]KKU67120.1 MAG: hypothetical protein UX91_C0006G0182 [Candidatus Amesbacteria bacterium GW2011_GWB1_47_19]OGD05476.1 MAG: hypothetical protein A2379_00770 [Candidatus Amesbacteria bacterium RIFOXYB1_FULL_47_13]HBC72990.1 hypothetical protein [Candidatus Amesbacteria bacterium]
MEIDAKARKCPHCQTDQRIWFARHPILTGLLVLFVIGILGTAMGGGNKSGSGPAGTSDAQPTVAPVAQKITAGQLADDFDANQVAAEANWKGKVVEFSAVVSNITDSGISFYNVASKEFSMTQISCRISDKNQLMSLTNGQSVTVRGTVGSQTIGVVGLDDCTVVQ